MDLPTVHNAARLPPLFIHLCSQTTKKKKARKVSFFFCSFFLEMGHGKNLLSPLAFSVVNGS